jgi:hypothetical protein
MSEEIKEQDAKTNDTFPPAPPLSKIECHPNNTENDSGKHDHDNANKFCKSETITAIFTGVIAIWTIVYSIFAGLQWLEMRQGSELTQRAYLSAKSPETWNAGFGLLNIPVENYGHVPSRWFTIHLNYIWIKTDFNTGAITYLDNRTLDLREDKPIYPGPNNHQIVVMIPQNGNAPKTLTKDQSIMIRARITYDTGFGKTDTLTLCESFSLKSTHWENCGGLSTNIALDEAAPTQKKDN